MSMLKMTLIIDLRSGAFEKNGKRKPSKQLLSNAVARAPGRVRYFLGRLLITSNYFLRKFCLVLINNLGKLLGQTASASGQTGQILPKRKENSTWLGDSPNFDHIKWVFIKSTVSTGTLRKLFQWFHSITRSDIYFRCLIGIAVRVVITDSDFNIASTFKLPLAVTPLLIAALNT